MRDRTAETFLKSLIDEESKNADDLDDEERRTSEVAKKVTARMHEVGASMALKFGPVLKAMLEHMETLNSQSELAVISVPSSGIKTKSDIFKRMFFRLLASPQTSFRVSKKSSLGNLTGHDYFVLSMFIFATCQRSGSDRMLALFVSGATSVGKSMCVEQVLMQNSHQLLSSSASADPGCGRFNTRNKNVIMLRDTTLANIFSSDLDRLKCIARGETTTVKVHSSTEMLHPSFLFVSSNERLFDHTFFTPSGFPDKAPSHARQVKRATPEHLEAIRARFLEMHVRRRCHQDPEDLRQSYNFQRCHLIVATFDYCLQVLQQFQPSDFPSQHMYHYLLCGLEKNVALYAAAQKVESDGLSAIVSQLKAKYGLQPPPSEPCAADAPRSSQHLEPPARIKVENGQNYEPLMRIKVEPAPHFEPSMFIKVEK